MGFLLLLVVLILLGGAAEYLTYTKSEGGVVSRFVRHVQNTFF